MPKFKELAEKYPEEYSAFYRDVKAEASKELLAEQASLIESAIEGERARIKGVFDQMRAGHEKTVLELMFDGKSTAGDAAIRINQAEKSILEAKAKELEDDAQPPVDHDEPGEKEKVTSKGFMEQAQDVAKERKISLADAIQALAIENPELHKAFLDQSNGGEK